MFVIQRLYVLPAMRSTLSKLNSLELIIGGGQHRIYIFNLNPDSVMNINPIFATLLIQ